MDIKELEKIMISHGVALRAIPEKVRHVLEKQHIDRYPNGTIEYLDEFKREMLVFESIPKNAGKFILVKNQATSCNVSFTGKEYFDSIEQAMESLLKDGSKSF